MRLCNLTDQDLMQLSESLKDIKDLVKQKIMLHLSSRLTQTLLAPLLSFVKILDRKCNRFGRKILYNLTDICIRQNNLLQRRKNLYFLDKLYIDKISVQRI